MRPFPERMYQTSSTVRWATAFDTAFGDSEKIARPPRDNWHSTRTSEPSGAIASALRGRCLVSNFIHLPDGRTVDFKLARQLSHGACETLDGEFLLPYRISVKKPKPSLGRLCGAASLANSREGIDDQAAFMAPADFGWCAGG